MKICCWPKCGRDATREYMRESLCDKHYDAVMAEVADAAHRSQAAKQKA